MFRTIGYILRSYKFWQDHNATKLHRDSGEVLIELVVMVNV